LANLITETWRRVEKLQHDTPRHQLRAALSPEGVTSLVELAYRASFLRDEGRYVRVRLYVADEFWDRQFPAGALAIFTPPLIIRFVPAIPLVGPDVLRWLAPTIPVHHHALLVSEQNGALCCEGVIDLSERESLGHAGDPLKYGWRGYRGLFLRVDAPGKLRVSDPILHAAELEAGQLSAIVPFSDNPFVSTWLSRVSNVTEERLVRTAATVSQDAERIARDEVIRDPATSMHEAVVDAWSRVLMTVEGLRHGGALVVLPNPGEPVLEMIKPITPAADLRLSDRIVEFWMACIDVMLAADQSARNVATREWAHKRNCLFSAIETLGHLTAADGCVVVDNEMGLCGFRGKIQVDDSVLRASGRTLVDARTREPISEQETLARFGTRHESAFRLCKKCEGALVFVVSQDGDLRVFTSDTDHVYMDEHLSPALSQTDVS
jgi:hypothetical protein